MTDKQSDRGLQEPGFDRRLLDAVDLSVIATDLDWKIIYWNRFAEELYGWNADDVIGCPILDVIPNLASRRQASEIMHRLNAGQSWSGEFPVMRKDKTTFIAHVHDSPIFNEKKEVIGMVGVSIDFTKQKEIEADLRLKEKAMASSIDGVAFCDMQGRMSYVNKTFLEMWGFESENEVLGHLAVDFWKDIQRAVDMMGEVAEKKKIVGQLTGKRKDGSHFEVELRGSRIDSEDGTPLFLTGSFVDITQREQAKALLAERNKKLDCLYWMGELVEEPGITLPEILQGTIDIMPEAFRFPEAASARITLHAENKIVVSESFQESEICLDSEIWANGDKAGLVEVFYMAGQFWMDGQPFMEEEKKLIDAIAGRLGRIIERFFTKNALQEREDRYYSLFKQSNDAIFIHDVNGKILEVNRRACEMLEYDRESLLALKITDLHPKSEMDVAKQALEKVGKRGSTLFETRFLRAGGMDMHVEISSRLIDREKGLVQGIARDISERKHQEAERELTIQILKLINSSDHTRDLIRLATRLIQEWSGCHAVGIRIKEGEDYPYYETRGFPQSFVDAENTLCTVGPNGNILRDNVGNPVLECMCGNVICGRFDPSKPFFTENGSFWTNCTSDLLASTTEEDRMARTRNRCNGEGYESVALIPMRTAREGFGLLQINDFRRNRFTERNIALYESLANSLAMALAERRAYDTMRENEQKFRILVENQNDLVVKFDVDWRLTFVNPRYCEIFGETEHELIGRTFAPFIHEDDRTEVVKLLEKLRWPPYKTYHEERAMTVTGFRWFGWSAQTIRDANGNIIEFISVGRDIDDRKIAELELNKKIDQLNRSNQLMVGRELEMIRLKREVNSLLEELGRPKRYKAPDQVDGDDGGQSKT